jgi:hypothetical protein
MGTDVVNAGLRVVHEHLCCLHLQDLGNGTCGTSAAVCLAAIQNSVRLSAPHPLICHALWGQCTAVRM